MPLLLRGGAEVRGGGVRASLFNQYHTLHCYHHPSFYKGVPVFRTNFNRSGSFGAIFLRREWTDIYGVKHKLTDPDEVNHERGHNSQLMMMGIATYGFSVGIPSPLKLGGYAARGHYNDAPWEAMANIMGGTTHLFKESASYQRAWDYYWKSMLFFPSVVSYW